MKLIDGKFTLAYALGYFLSRLPLWKIGAIGAVEVTSGLIFAVAMGIGLGMIVRAYSVGVRQ